MDEAANRLAEAERVLPNSLAPRLQAERIRLALAQGRIDEAVSSAANVKPESADVELDFARLECYLAVWRRAQQSNDAAGKAKWERAAVAQARAIGQAQSAGAARRAETMLARSIVQSGGSEGPRATLLAAQSLYRGGRLDEALATFDKAAHRAAAVEDKDAAFDAYYSAAALEQERGNHAEAASRFRRLALAAPENPRAPAAHFLAVHSAAQVARQQHPPQLDEYGQLLREHVEKWPQAKTAAQAWSWLGRLAEHQGAWQEGIAALAHIEPDNPQYAAAVAATGRCYLAALAELRSRRNTNSLLARDAIAYFQTIIGPADRPYDDASREAVLALARIYLLEVPGAARKAEELISAAIDESENAGAEWRNAAGLLQVAALAADGNLAAAEQTLKQLPPADPAAALQLVEMLETVRRRAARADKPKIAEVELAVIAGLSARQQDLDEAGQKQLAGLRVDILASLSRRPEALAELRTLAEKYPRDGAMQEKLATLLAEGEDRESREAALAKWREIAGHTRPGSERWYRAQFASARLQFDLDDSVQARATIKRVEANHPEMGGEELKARFLQLLAECEREIAAAQKAGQKN
jgi:tetratricopeptide (TPR) repeat protein